MFLIFDYLIVYLFGNNLKCLTQPSRTSVRTLEILSKIKRRVRPDSLGNRDIPIILQDLYDFAGSTENRKSKVILGFTNLLVPEIPNRNIHINFFPRDCISVRSRNDQLILEQTVLMYKVMRFN